VRPGAEMRTQQPTPSCNLSFEICPLHTSCAYQKDSKMAPTTLEFSVSGFDALSNAVRQLLTRNEWPESLDDFPVSLGPTHRQLFALDVVLHWVPKVGFQKFHSEELNSLSEAIDGLRLEIGKATKMQQLFDVKYKKHPWNVEMWN
jgi:hypothetical protein